MIPVSLLSAYQYCPRKVYLEKILKLKEPSREVNLKGTIKHMVFSGFSERERLVVSSIYPEHTFSDVKKLFEDAFAQELKNAIILKKKAILRLNFEPAIFYNKLWPAFEEDLNSRAKRVWEFMQKRKLFGKTLWESLIPKTKSEYKVESESLELKGVIDQVLVYEDSLTPLEIKSGKPPDEGVWPGHKLQLAAYMLLLEDIFSFTIKKGVVYYLQDGQREIYMNPFLKTEVLKAKDNVKRLLNSKSPPPIIKKEGKCSVCAFRDKCHDPEYISQIQQKTLNTT